MLMVSVQVALSLGYGSNAIKYSLFFAVYFALNLSLIG